MPTFSIIVPVYKTDRYLDACVKSVLAQTNSDFELILVDDGSPDLCPEICDAWAAKDKRIHVLHQKNSGVSSARNAGISVATGEWIMFLDSDDTVVATMLETIDELQEENLDIINFGIQVLTANTQYCTSCPPFTAKASDITDSGLFAAYYTSALAFLCVNKFYRCQWIKMHSLSFSIDMTLAEDMNFTSQCFAENPMIRNTDACLYLYYKRAGEENATAKFYPDLSKRSFEIFQTKEHLFQKLGYTTQLTAFRDDALPSVYRVEYFNLNHMNCPYSFASLYASYRRFFRIREKRQEILRVTSSESASQGKCSAAVSHFCIRHHLLLALTIFTKVKAWILKRKNRK